VKRGKEDGSFDFRLDGAMPLTAHLRPGELDMQDFLNTGIHENFLVSVFLPENGDGMVKQGSFGKRHAHHRFRFHQR
jgi:hypothetical protein